MNSHFCVLPSDVIQSLSQSTQPESDEVPDLKQHKEPRMLRLPHPRTGLSSLYLPTEWVSESPNGSSLLEVQAVSPPDERSWILGEEIIADGKLLVMTPVDPSFLLISIMQALQPIDGSTVQFRPADDLLDEAFKKLETPNEINKELASNAHDVIDFCSLSCVRKCLSRVCETKEISPELIVYRYSPTKSMEYIRSKVARVSASDTFSKSQTITRNLAKDGLMEDGKEELLIIGRLRAACDLVSQYLPPATRDELINSYDFSKLEAHLASNKEEAVASAVVSASKKAQAKGEKTAVDKKRKAPKPSFGVEKLKKVNTTGMSKLSSFFAKAT